MTADKLLKNHKRDYDHFGTDVYDDDEIISLMKAYAKAKLEEAAEKLPNFIYKNPYGLLIVGVPGDSSVEYEWGEFKKSITNTPLD